MRLIRFPTMCGISGSVNYSFSEEKVLNSLRHRGPDEQNGYRSNNVQFYHLRLSILDIACGRQPMHLDDRYTIVFNGEIFNHNELRQRFGLKGKTSSDTETLLLLYEKFGFGFLNYLDGMFVFVIHDKIKNELFIARDRAGIKPLYYYRDNEKFVFASELNALKSILPLEICYENFFQYLRFGTFYKKNTPYKNVFEVEAGTFIQIDCSSLNKKETRWWDIHQFYLKKNNDSFGDALDKTDQILHTAVRRRIESSDLEVGAFLSGGIDSGLVTSVAHHYSPNLKTFTVSFEGEYDEAPLAKMVAEKYKTKHHEIKISFDNLQNDVEKILSNYGEPFFDSSAIPSYYVSKAAKEYVTVILNGDGADELFGGYRRYVPFAKFDFFKMGSFERTLTDILKKSLPASNNKKSLYNYFYRLLSFASLRGSDIYLSAGVDITEGFTKYFLDNGLDYMAEYNEDFDRIYKSFLNGLDKLMNLDFAINLFDDLLVKMDIATMANSQEGRSPFLCKEFLEYIPSLPGNYKVKGRKTKVLLRTLAEKYLPEELINQPKRGFEIPLKKWINEDLKEIIYDNLNTSNAFFKNFIDEKFVQQLLAHKIKISEEKRSKILWTIFAMEIWYKRSYRNQ